MKFVLIAALSLFSFNSFSKDKDKDRYVMDKKEMTKMYDDMSFEDAKEMKLKKIDEKTAMMVEERTCVSEAKDKDGLRKCMDKMWEDQMEMHKKMKEEMKAKTK